MGLVSAVVCTSGRPAGALRSARSLLASDGIDLDLIIVDQSEDRETERLLAGLPDRSRLRYVRSRTKGKGAAMNEGLRLARSEFVVCTDDDCEAPPDWVSVMATALTDRPRVAIVFSNVVAPPYDRTKGYVPTYEATSDRLVRSVFSTCNGRGLGAAIALRRDVIQELGGMDECLGPGAILGSAEDWDVELRTLLRGWEVLDTTASSIVHHGFRTFAEGREHARRDFLGLGAVAAKLVRAGHPSGAVLAAWEFGAHALWPPIRDVLFLRRPRGLQRIVGFSVGFARGLTTPVDRKTLCFRPRKADIGAG